MPEEPLNEEQQPEPTPHFDAFSGHADEPAPKVQSEPQPEIKPNSTFTPVQPEPTSPTPTPTSDPTPVQDGPMTAFAPNPVVSSETAVNPEQARVLEGVNLTPQSDTTVISSGTKMV
jgi:hypothetical protein